MPEIETARLRLRQLSDSDLDDYARLFAAPEYTRYSPNHLASGRVMEKARLHYVKNAHSYSVRCSVLYISSNKISAR